MKSCLIGLLIGIFALPCFAEHEFKRTNKFLLGGSFGEISKEQCVSLAPMVNGRLQSYAESESLPLDTFSMVTKIEYGRYNDHTVVLCYGHFSTKKPNYEFIVGEGTPRYGHDRNSKCADDHKDLESKSSILALRDDVDLGLDGHRYCAVGSIFAQRK